MGDIVGIGTKKVDQDSIKELEEILELFKTGELTKIVFVVSNDNKDTDIGWLGEPTRSMVGALRELEFDILANRYTED